MLLALETWLVAGWGAYRSRHHVSLFRSVPAFLLFLVLTLPISAALFAVANPLPH